MQGLDILVLLAVGIAALLGAKRGFIAEVLGLFAWVAMIFALKLFHLPLSKALAGFVGSASGATVLAFVVLTGGTFLLARIVINAIGSRTRTSVLGPIDRALGFGFGALKGLMLASLAYLLVVLVLDTLGGGPARRPEWITKARTYPLLNATSASIADVVDRRRKGQPMWGRRSDTSGAVPVASGENAS